MIDSQLKVWWIPQVPMGAFEVPVETIEEGVLLCNTLAAYDLFQYENRIKPDYSNAGGVAFLDQDGHWEDINLDDPDDVDYARSVLSDRRAI